MRTLQFRANVLACLLFMALAVFLYGPTDDLLASPSADGLGPGVVPLACIAGMFFLSAYMLVLAVVKYRATPLQERRGDGTYSGIPVRSYLGVSAVAIVLIASYVFLWKFTHFTIASSLFSCGMTVFVMPPKERTTAKIIKYSAGMVLFSLFVWLAFENLLNVSLR